MIAGSYTLLVSSAFSEFVKLSFLMYSGHCKKLQPEYEAAAGVLREQDGPGLSPQTIAKVDCTTQKEVAKRMGIKGYPTLWFFE